MPLNLPLPKVVADTEAGGGIPTAINALHKTQMLGAQARHAEEQSAANAFLTKQQAQWLPYQYQMQALSNPLLWMAAEKNPQLMNQLKNMMSNPMQSQGMSNQPLPNQSQGGILDWAMNALMQKLSGSGGNIRTTNPMTQSPIAQTQQQGGGQNFGANNLASPQEENNAANGLNLDGSPRTIGSQTPAATQAGSVATSGGLGGENPYSAANAQQQAMNTAVTGQQQNQNELQKQRSTQLTNQSQIATQALKSLDAFSRNYDKSSYKGQYITPERAENIPTLPGGTIAPEQLTTRYANQFLTDLSGLGDTPAGKTDEGRALIASGKLDISLAPEAKKELVDSFKAKLNRMVTLRDFGTDFYRRNPGATDEELVGLMNSYNKHAPSYDYEQGKSLPGNDKKFRDFTSPQALQAYRNNGDFDPYQKSPSENNYKPQLGKKSETKTIGGIKYIRGADGEWYE